MKKHELITMALGSALNGYFEAEKELKEEIDANKALGILEELRNDSVAYFAAGGSKKDFKEVVLSQTTPFERVSAFLKGYVANSKTDNVNPVEKCGCVRCTAKRKSESRKKDKDFKAEEVSDDKLPEGLEKLLKDIEKNTGAKATVFKIDTNKE